MDWNYESVQMRLKQINNQHNFEIALAKSNSELERIKREYAIAQAKENLIAYNIISDKPIMKYPDDCCISGPPITNCVNCGAGLNGCRCAYCGTVYV